MADERVQDTPRVIAQARVDERTKCKTDKIVLANQLGYDFQWETHAELFANYVKYNGSKPWAEQSETKDTMVLWSRGHYKTTSIIVEIIQAIINYPNIRILLMQGSIPVTKTLLKQVLAHFTGEAEGSRFNQLFPEFCGTRKELHGTQMQFTTAARTKLQLAQATVTVASPKSVKTGQHYDIGFFDDLVNDQNYRNPKLLQGVQESFTLAQALIDPGGYRIVTGTRYAFGDLYEQILRWQTKSGKWTVSVKDCWTDETAKLPDDQKVPRFPRFKKRDGQIGGFTREELLQMQEDDPSNFACQYLNKPIHTTQQAFTEELLHGACVPEKDTPPLSACILMIDLAVSDSVKADDSVIQVGRVDSFGVGYLCDQRGGQWQPLDMAMQVIDMAVHYRPTKIVLEKSAAGMVFVSVLKLMARQRNVYLPLEFVPVDNRDDAKNMRVVSLAGIIKRGKFKFLLGLPKFDRLIEQATQFPKGRYGHDDYIDTAALLYQELSKEMMSLPVRTPPRNPILAMIADRENGLVKALTEMEQQAVSQPDMTGWE